MINLYLNSNNSIQETLNSLKPNTAYTIHLSAGIYRENIIIRNDNLTFIGSGFDTIIVANKHAKQINLDLKPNITFRTETVRVLSSNVSFKNLTIQNDSGIGPGVGQGVALSLYGNKCRLTDCQILGTHDTIFLGPLPLDLIERYQDIITFDFKHYDSPLHLFNNCKISGTVDFIFGSGKAIFYRCEINALAKGYIVAPSTYKHNPIGIVLYECTINNLANEPVYLARPWREDAYVAFINNTFNGLFESERFHDWEKNNFRFYEIPYIKSKLGSAIPNEDLVRINLILKEELKL